MTEDTNFLANSDCNIQISGNVATITMVDARSKAKGGNAITCKTVSMQSLLKAFKNHVSDIASPMLPIGTVRYFEKGNDISLIMFHESDRFDACLLMGHDDSDRPKIKTIENCVRPSVIMKHIIRNRGRNHYELASSQVYAVKEASSLLVNDATVLYRLPFPNVYADGKVCWGHANDRAGTMESLAGLKAYVERLFRSVFNRDLFDSNLFSSLGINSPEALFEQLSNKDLYPDKFFLPLAESKTLGGLSR